MTTRKQLKNRVRSRMARTGESYTTALRHTTAPGHTTGTVVAEPPATPWLTGGVDPVAASLAHVFAHHGVRAGGAPLTEALLFGIAGGPGAGYILWEFERDGSRPVVIGFASQWQYIDRAPLAALERLGVPVHVHRTGGAVGATRELDASLAAGRPALVWPDRVIAGYRHLPAALDGMGGHVVVVHGQEAGSYLVDDRTVAPIAVPIEQFGAARARVGSYRNLLMAPAPDGDVPAATLEDAVRSGIADCAERLSRTSTSFSLPAWAKWARLMTDAKNAKGWPQVFADGRGLVGALASIWECASPAGMTGGHLRDLTADFLDAAGPVLAVPVDGAVAAWRVAAAAWQAVADTALPIDVPEFERLRTLTVAVQESITADGDAGRAEAAAAAAQLWELRADLDPAPPLSPEQQADLFAAIGAALRTVHTAERAAVAELAALGQRGTAQ